MEKNLIINQHLSGISRNVFVPYMSALWLKKKNKPSPALEEAWWVLADAFNHQIAEAPINRWKIIPMPTGSGKTLGLSAYCSLLEETTQHPGVLIVTQFIDEANKLAKSINALTGHETAIADHGKIKNRSTERCQSSPVLVVTHKAFTNTLEAESWDGEEDHWHKFLEWEHGTRKLIVIDEAMDMVQHATATLADLELVRTYIPSAMAEEFQYEAASLDAVIGHLRHRVTELEVRKDVLIPAFSVLGDKEETKQTYPNFRVLLEALRDAPLDEFVLGKKDAKERKALSKKCTVALSNLNRLCRNWSRLSKSGDSYKWTTAHVMLPPELKSAVILDATALPNSLYDLLGSIPDYTALSGNIRNYKKANLHVFWGHPVGKLALMKQPPEHFVQLVESLSKCIGKKNRVLFCVHKDVEKQFANFGKKYADFATVHWGDIAGKNDWQTFDSIVLYGLPYLDPTTEKNIVQAFVEWHRKTNGKNEKPYEFFDEETQSIYYYDTYVDKADFRASKYLVGYMVASLVQAINRVQCRRVSDGDGNCDPTNIYLYLNKGAREQKLLEGVMQLMPGINLIESGKATKEEAISRDEDELLRRLKRLKSGKHDAAIIQKKAKVSDRTMQRIAKKIKHGSALTSQLAALGITYHAKSGKGGYRYFLKEKVAVIAK